MSYPVYTVYAGDVLPILFDSFDGGTGASITMTGLATTDIEIYKDGSTTQRASEAGYTLLDTDGIDFDGITGIHGFSIDTGDNTDAGFYAVGSWFHVVVSSITIDGQTVNFVAAAFRIVAAEAVAGVPVVDVKAISGDTTAADNEELMFDGTGYAGGTTKFGVDVVAISGDSTAADNCELDYDGTGYAGGTIVKGADITKIMGTALSETSAGYLAAGFKKLLDVASPVFTLSSVNQTGDSYARLGSPAGASIAADLVTIDNFVDDLETRLTATRAGYLDIINDWVDGGRLDLLLDAIKVPTDKMAFTVANKLDVNVYTWNGTAVTAPAIAGSPVVTLNATQAAYAPAKAGDAMTLTNDAITAAKFDESTAFPLASADTGVTILARAGDAMSLSATGVAAVLDHAVMDHLTAGTVGALIASLGGKMTVVGNQLIVYAANNTTELFRFNLTDAAGDPTMTNVYTRTVTAAP